MRLICKTTEAIKTDEGDFVPKGTPVEVISWADTRFVLCRATAYMFAGELPENPEKQNNIGTKLYINVDFADLEYLQTRLDSEQ